MAIGNSYPIRPIIQAQDLFLGTRYGSNSTVNYTTDAIVDYLNINASIAVGGQLTFQFLISTYGPKSIFFSAGGGDGTPFSSITQLIISSTDCSGSLTNIFVNYLVGKDILLSQQNTPNSFAQYKITSYTVTATPGFYTLNLQYIGGNGNIGKDLYYTISQFFVNDIPLVPTLQSVTDAGNTSSTSIFIEDTYNSSEIAPSYISTTNLITGSTSYLSSDGYLGLGNGIIGALLKTTNVTQSFILEFPNKPSGSYTIATTADIPAAVTSVGLSMPSAFTVTNNPVTSSGTLTVTGAGTVSQYVRGDGSLANFPTSTGGGSSLAFYLNGSVSQGTFGGVAFKEMDRTPILGAGTDFTISSNGYIQSFITDAGVPNLLEIPAGNWNFETYFSASSNGGSPSFYVELYKWNGTTLSLIASNSANPEGITNGTVTDLYLSALAVPQTTLALTDRLAVRIYVNNSGRTIKLHTENGHLCEIITTFSTGLTALNGLTAQVQSFATGTSGTDFAISSATATHTFNLPTASATNRGALSSTDWSAFNGKFTLPALTSGSVLFSNGTTIAQDNSNFFWDDTNNRLGIGTATPAKKLDVTGIIRGWGSGATDLSSTIIGAAFQTEYSNNPSVGTLAIGTLQAGGGSPAHYIQAVNTAGTIAKNITLNPYGGNILIGTTTDAGFKLDVNGTARVSGQLTLGGSVNLSADSTISIGNATSRINGFFVRSISSGANTLDVIGTSHNFIDAAVGIRLKIFSGTGNVQVQNGGTYTDIASARLTVNSTTQGFLPPRMTNAQRLAIATPAVGLIVYCTDVVEGLYINKSTGWTFVV